MLLSMFFYYFAVYKKESYEKNINFIFINSEFRFFGKL